MFKLAVVLAAVMAVAVAAPGGLTGVHVSHGLGPIHAPHIVSAVPHHYAAHVVAQPVAPVVHAAPIVTHTVLAGHGHGVALGHGLHGLHGLHG